MPNSERAPSTPQWCTAAAPVYRRRREDKKAQDQGKDEREGGWGRGGSSRSVLSARPDEALEDVGGQGLRTAGGEGMQAGDEGERR
jgi:hypothetical protein